MMPKGVGKKRISLSQAIESVLVAQISDGRLRGGEQLPTEAAIMREHGVSRTVVREAISRLQASGRVVTHQGVGTFVCGSTLSLTPLIDPTLIDVIADSLAIMELRIGLEVEAAGLAAQRRTQAQLDGMREVLDKLQQPSIMADQLANLDVQFHLAIAEATGNPYISKTLRDLGEVLVPRRRLNTARLFQDDPLSYEQRIHDEHERIYAAIFQQNTERARAAMRLHLDDSRVHLRQASEPHRFTE